MQAGRIRLKNLNRSGEHKSGRPRWYYRPKGHKGIPLPDAPMDNVVFLKAYAEAANKPCFDEGMRSGALTVDKNNVVTRHDGPLSRAIEKYLVSDYWLLLGEGTKKVRRSLIDKLRQKYGHEKRITPDIIFNDCSQYTGHRQHTQLKTWRGLCKFLLATGVVQTDPSKGVPRAPVAHSDGHLPWTDADIEMYRNHFALNQPERLAFEVLYYTGARTIDAVAMGNSMITSGGWLSYRQSKTKNSRSGGHVEVPFDRDLPAFARRSDASLTLRHLKQSLAAQTPISDNYWIVTVHNMPRSEKAFSNWFSEKARLVGLQKKTAHGLRKTRAIQIAENGGTAIQLMSWCGWDSLQQAQEYIVKINKRNALID